MKHAFVGLAAICMLCSAHSPLCVPPSHREIHENFMRKFASTVAPEDAWMFVPATGELHDVGYDGKFNAVTFDTKLLCKYMELHDVLALYHTHPAEMFGRFRIGQTERMVVPSVNDLTHMLIASSIFYRLHPNGNYCERICSFHGVTEYSISKSGVAALSQETVLYEAQKIFDTMWSRQIDSVSLPMTLYDDDVTVRFTPY